MERRMLSRVGRCAMLSTLSVLMLGSIALSAEYSADISVKMGGTTTKHHLYVKGDMMRQEINLPGSDKSQVVIVRPDKKVAWMLDPSNKSYMQMPMDAKGGASKKWADMVKNTKFVKLVGTETIKGYLCDKYKVHQQMKGRDGKPGIVDATVWVSRKLNNEIKSVQSAPNGNMTMEMVNVKEKTQPVSLFNIPKGYKKLDMPSMGAPGMGMKGGRGPK